MTNVLNKKTTLSKSNFRIQEKGALKELVNRVDIVISKVAKSGAIVKDIDSYIQEATR